MFVYGKYYSVRRRVEFANKTLCRFYVLLCDQVDTLATFTVEGINNISIMRC